MTASITYRQQAEKAPFEAFGTLYYPLFRNRAALPTALADADMAWAMTAYANLQGTGYTLSQQAIHTLAACHHALADLAHGVGLLPLATAADMAIDPLADLRRLVPDVTATPLYPDFPVQVMEVSEAQFRYDQACHYLSTYGVEALAGSLGLDVTVGEGWRPQVEATPKTERDEALVPPKVLHVLVTVEDLQAVVAARLARATRMHPAEIATTLLVFDGIGDETGAGVFSHIAFHENMMELIRAAAACDSATLERVAAGLAQHPGDLLKATRYLLESQPGKRLATREKKALCRAFERFDTLAIARNIVDAGRKDRLAPNYLSVARFGGPRLREAIQLVESGQVRSWASKLERLWTEVRPSAAPAREAVWQRLFAEYEKHPGVSLRDQFNETSVAIRRQSNKSQGDAWPRLLAHYGQRPGVLLRSLARLIKGGCPSELLRETVFAHVDSFSLPTLVRTLTLFSTPNSTKVTQRSWAGFGLEKEAQGRLSPEQGVLMCSLLEELVRVRLRSLTTPLAGKRIWLDTAGISLVGSVLVPNETGMTGTAWPPVGIAFDLPADKTVRFFTFWDDRAKRVDVDLHFVGQTTSGEPLHVGWNAAFRGHGLVTSGDVTTSHDAVEYLDADMRKARETGVAYVVQQQHIFSGAPSWGDIKTCYSGALVVGKRNQKTALYNAENLLFRDDLTGEGRSMSYAVVNVPEHYVRILRGTSLPLGTAGFSLGSYLGVLFEAQQVTLVDAPEDADLRVCVGRSDDPAVVSLFDEGFFLG